MIRSLYTSLLHRAETLAPVPTARAFTLLLSALALYFFGNQTQVGWLYVMSALLAGVVLAAGWLNRRALHGMTAERRVGDGPQAELYEGDRVDVRLSIAKAGRGGAAHVLTAERCPLAAPGTPEREMALFVPALPPHGAVHFRYSVEIDRRGVQRFPRLDLASRAPFGFFRRRRCLDLPTPVLVYPEVRALSRLRMLDQRLAPEFALARAGVGTEVLGVRPFRSGDSFRHIHWRSVARTRQLISKEFADENQPGLTLVLDLYAHPYPPSESKHTPFEWAVKVAASIGDYACRQGHPLYLLADEDAWPPPAGPLARQALLEYLARVQPTGRRSLADALGRGVPPSSPCVAVVLPWPDPAALGVLSELRQRGTALSVVLLDPASFPTGGPADGPPAGPLADALNGAGVEAQSIRFGEDWTERLAAW